MFKKLFGLFLLALALSTANAATSTLDPQNASNTISLQGLYKFKQKTVNEIEYWWVLHNDGCFYLYRVEIVGGLLEFWTPLGPLNYIGNTSNCAYSQEQMEVLC